MSKNNSDKYKEAIDWLDDQYAFFLTHVLGIGRPLWTNTIPTAGVALEDPKNSNPDDFSFIFNPEFADTLAVEEMGFVLGHETMHILLNHLRLAPKFSDPMAFNIAADLVINDYLVAAGLDAPKQAMRGKEIVGYNCANCTVTEVYDDVIQEMKKQKNSDGDGDGNGQPGSGLPNYRELDNHDWLHGQVSKALQDALDAIYEKVKDEMPADLDEMREDMDYQSGMKMAGTQQGREQDFMAIKGVSLAWAELLKEIHPDIFKGKGYGPPPRPSYHKRPRKLGGFPDVILPVKRPGTGDRKLTDEKPSIVMALDTSGSIRPDDARRFVTLAQSIPTDKIHLHACTFTTQYEELDLKDPHYHSGGTSFSAIQEYIRDKVMPQTNNKYPTAVVVITDGCASFDRAGKGAAPTPAEAPSWYWLLTNDYYSYGDAHTRYGRNEKLERFCR